MDLAGKVNGRRIEEIFRKNTVGMETFSIENFHGMGPHRIALRLTTPSKVDLETIRRFEKERISFWITVRGGVEIKCHIRMDMDPPTFSQDDYRMFMTVMTLNVTEFRQQTMLIGQDYRYPSPFYDSGLVEINPYYTSDRTQFSDRTPYNYRDDRRTSLWSTDTRR